MNTSTNVRKRLPKKQLNVVKQLYFVVREIFIGGEGVFFVTNGVIRQLTFLVFICIMPTKHAILFFFACDICAIFLIFETPSRSSFIF